MNPVTPEQVLEFSQRSSVFRRLTAQLIQQATEEPVLAFDIAATGEAIRTLIELKDMLDSQDGARKSRKR